MAGGTSLINSLINELIIELIQGIYHGYTWGMEGRPETTKLSHLNAINFN